MLLTFPKFSISSPVVATTSLQFDAGGSFGSIVNPATNFGPLSLSLSSSSLELNLNLILSFFTETLLDRFLILDCDYYFLFLNLNYDFSSDDENKITINNIIFELFILINYKYYKDIIFILLFFLKIYNKIVVL